MSDAAATVGPWLALLAPPAAWLYMHRCYKRLWGRSLRWWAVPFAHGALLFSHRLEGWEK